VALCADADSPTNVKHAFICAGQGVVCRVSADGEVEWECRAGGPCLDVWQLPNGNVLFTFKRGAKEVSPDKKVVWQYLGPKGCEIYSCSPLGDGRYLIGEQGKPPRLLEVDRKGSIIKEIQVKTKTKRVHGQFRQVRKTTEGTYLVAQTGERQVCEYDGKGQVIRTIKVPGNPFVAVRLPNGNTLIACGDGHKLIEVDRDGKVVWRLDENELTGHPLRFVAGVQRLPNGNTVVCNWGGHGHVGQQPQIFEVTRDKRVVWQFFNKTDRRFRTIASVQLLDIAGDPTQACKRR